MLNSCKYSWLFWLNNLVFKKRLFALLYVCFDFIKLTAANLSKLSEFFKSGLWVSLPVMLCNFLSKWFLLSFLIIAGWGELIFLSWIRWPASLFWRSSYSFSILICDILFLKILSDNALLLFSSSLSPPLSN